MLIKVFILIHLLKCNNNLHNRKILMAAIFSENTSNEMPILKTSIRHEGLQQKPITTLWCACILCNKHPSITLFSQTKSDQVVSMGNVGVWNQLVCKCCESVSDNHTVLTANRYESTMRCWNVWRMVNVQFDVK